MDPTWESFAGAGLEKRGRIMLYCGSLDVISVGYAGIDDIQGDYDVVRSHDVDHIFEEAIADPDESDWR